MEAQSEARGALPATPSNTPLVVVTRPRRKAGAMIEGFRALGLRVLHLPTIEIVPPEDPEELRSHVERLRDYDWVVFTSASGVRAVAGILEGGAPTGADRPRVAAVGPSTADAVRDLLGWPVAVVPETFTGEGLLAAFDAAGGVTGDHIFLPVAERGRDLLPLGLAERGARVDRVVAYRSVAPGECEVAPVREALRDGEVALLTFTSPSTAENMLEILGPTALCVPAAVIGPVTARAAEAMGYSVRVVAGNHTMTGLVEAVGRHLEQGAR